MRILYILKHDPWGIGGGCNVSLMYLTAFRRLFPKHQFDVCICQECMEHQPELWKGKCKFISVPPRGKIARLLSVFSGIMHRHHRMALSLIRKHEYDYCVFDHSDLAGTLCSHLKANTKSVVIHHNYEPQYFKDNVKSYIYKLLFIRHVRSAEKKAYLKCHYNIFLTKEDEELFRQIYGVPFGKSACIGIFDLHVSNLTLPNHVYNSKLVVVITGSLNNVQNTDGIVYFMKELYPLIADKCKIIIAGKNPTSLIQDITKGYENVELIPNPLHMNDIISRGDIYICPTRLGGGIKVRISDGLRTGLPVIAQSVSARGYGDFISKGFFYPYKTPSEFLEQFNKLNEDIKNKQFTSKDIAQFFQLNNSFTSGMNKLKQLLEI